MGRLNVPGDVTMNWTGVIMLNVNLCAKFPQCNVLETGTSIYAVAAHEFGHSLGIRHSNVRGSLMFPWYDQHNPIVRLHSDDIAAVRKLYGWSISIIIYDVYYCALVVK